MLNCTTLLFFINKGGINHEGYREKYPKIINQLIDNITTMSKLKCDVGHNILGIPMYYDRRSMDISTGIDNTFHVDLYTDNNECLKILEPINIDGYPDGNLVWIALSMLTTVLINERVTEECDIPSGVDDSYREYFYIIKYDKYQKVYIRDFLNTYL